MSIETITLRTYVDAGGDTPTRGSDHIITASSFRSLGFRGPILPEVDITLVGVTQDTLRAAIAEAEAGAVASSGLYPDAEGCYTLTVPFGV